MVLVNVFGREVELDDDLARLVRALDSHLRGLEVSSARTDEHATAETGRAACRHYLVSFCILNWLETWTDLTMLAAAVSVCEDATLVVDYDGCTNDRPDDPDLLSLYLHGTGSPEQLAGVIEGLAAEQPRHFKIG
ncbi:MAG: hypothetical protein DWQ37_04335 [Planctomycetota bacterium]|nr:MAG: hypothetical protein DWQ37_04335 [Planctomycetota bacterium]